MKAKGRYKDAPKYAALIAAAVLFIVIGNRLSSGGIGQFTGISGGQHYTDRYIVRVDEILSSETTGSDMEGSLWSETKIKFSATVVWGERRGDTLIAYQTYDAFTGRITEPVRRGDKIFVYLNANTGSDYYAGEFVRLGGLAAVAVLFVALLLLFGRLKGAATVAALTLSVLSVFLVFIPSILSGRSIYLSATVICLFSILTNPFLIGGFNKKSLASALGSMGGVAVAGLLTVVLNSWLRITGIVDEDAMNLVLLFDNPVDMKALTFAAVLIGALGACLDVSMSIAASVDELNTGARDNSFGSLLRSGMNIGRDIMGAQTGTLILAYIGSSLTVVVLLSVFSSSLLELLNMEMVVTEILQALIGAFTILFTIPATAAVSAALYSRGGRGGGSGSSPR